MFWNARICEEIFICFCNGVCYNLSKCLSGQMSVRFFLFTAPLSGAYSSDKHLLATHIFSIFFPYDQKFFDCLFKLEYLLKCYLVSSDCRLSFKLPLHLLNKTNKTKWLNEKSRMFFADLPIFYIHTSSLCIPCQFSTKKNSSLYRKDNFFL